MKMSARWRKLISVRTKAGLQLAKVRGTKLGGFRGGHALGNANAVRVAGANANAAKVIGLIRPLRTQGMSLRQIADELNEAMPDGNWSATKVLRALNRNAER